MRQAPAGARKAGVARPALLATPKSRRIGTKAGPAVFLSGLLLGAILVGLACQPHAARHEPVLLFAGNDYGILAACGCPGNPSGGFAKRQGLVEQYRRRYSSVLLLDAGDLMPDHENPALVRTLARAASRAAYAAIACGDQEFLLGAERLRQLVAEFDLPLLCANVRDARGEFVVAPHVVRALGDLKIGLFAVVADRAYGFPPMEWRKGLVVEDSIAAAKRQMEALAGCDLVVAISHQPLEETRRLAVEVPGLDVVVSGHDATTLLEPERIGRTLLVGAGSVGDILGALRLEGGRKGDRRWRQDLTELSARVPGAPWVEDLYWEYVKEAGEKPLAGWDTPIPLWYEPAEACAECHEKEYEQWRSTAHARAYQSIRKAGRQDDPECLFCHTMGFGRQGGFVSIQKTPALGRVTCQACHAVTSRHAKEGDEADPRLLLSSRWCMSCHGPVQSPGFDCFVYKPRVVHKQKRSRGDE